MYKASRNNVTSELRLARYLYEKGLASKIKGGNKQFWKYVCFKTKTVKKVNRFKGQDATLTLNDSETANALNEFLAHLSRRLKGELIVYQSSCRLCVCVCVCVCLCVCP